MTKEPKQHATSRACSYLCYTLPSRRNLAVQVAGNGIEQHVDMDSTDGNVHLRWPQRDDLFGRQRSEVNPM